MILYHGSKSGIKGDIAPKSRDACDFGQGFYQIRQSTTSIGAMHRMGVGECLFLIDF